MNRTRAVLLLLAALSASACRTPTAPERASAACAHAEDYGAALVALADEIDFTCETLRALQANAVDSRGSNRETLETFERGVKNLAVRLADARKEYARMNADTHAFLGSFGADPVTLRDASLARETEERRASLQASFETLAREDLALQRKLERYRLDLADLAESLGRDLTPRGFSAAATAIERANQGGSALRAELALLAARVDAARTELEPLRAPAYAPDTPAGN